jgi:hypothetical protein
VYLGTSFWKCKLIQLPGLQVRETLQENKKINLGYYTEKYGQRGRCVISEKVPLIGGQIPELSSIHTTVTVAGGVRGA